MTSLQIDRFRKSVSYHRPWFTVWPIALSLAIVFSNAANAAALSIEEIRDRHERWRSAIASLEYSAEITGRVFNTPAGVTRVLRRTYRAMNGYRYLENQHLWPDLDWNDDLKWARIWLRPMRVEVLAVLDRHCVTSEKYALAAKNNKLEDVENDIYLACSGWWPHGQQPEPFGGVHLSLMQNGWRIGSDPDVIDGRACLVMAREESNITETLWLDAGRDCVVVRREFQHAERHATYLVQNSDFREVAPNVFLPWKLMRHVIVRPGEPPDAPTAQEQESSTFSKSVISINNLRINHLAPPAFLPTLPPGTIQADADTGRLKILPGGREVVLDDMIRVASKTMPATQRRTSHLLSLFWTPLFLSGGILLRLGIRRIAPGA